MSLKKLFFLSFFVVFRAISATIFGYRFKLDIGNPDILCPSPNYKCPNGKIHYLCKNTTLDESGRCHNYEIFNLTPKFKKSLVEGTNGIRNKIAFNFGISNMNIVYWSAELSKMAAKFARECTRGPDPCLIVGEKQIRLSQNYYFVTGAMQDRVAGRIVRHWYLELGTDVQNWRDYKRKHLSGQMNSLTTMIYPLIEFIGCGGARMSDGYFVTCYYHPPYNRSEFPKYFSNGYPCTNCSETRTTCSKTFTSLCGLDIAMDGTSFLRFNFYLLLTCIFLSFI